MRLDDELNPKLVALHCQVWGALMYWSDFSYSSQKQPGQHESRVQLTILPVKQSCGGGD